MAFRSQSRRVHQQLLPCLFWVILATAMIAPFEASAKAIALVVGIKEYSGHGLPELITPENDATGFAQKLIDIHSYSAQDVHVLLGSKQQADRKSILAKWAELVGKLQEHDAIVFFFAGHAIELKGRNYFHTQDTKGMSPASPEPTTGEFTLSSLDFQSMLEQVRTRELVAGGLVGIFIIDACRVNPFQFDQETRDSSTVGTAGADLPSTELFIMYSAGVGQSASDGRPGAVNSLFTEALLEQMQNRDIPVAELAQRVRFKVNKSAIEINHTQTPAVYDQFLKPKTLAGARAYPEQFIATNEQLGSRIKWSELQKGDSVIECTHCPEMVVIERGDYQRGSAPTQTGHSDHEGPVRTVQIKKSFALGKFEVTNREWDLYQCAPDDPLDPKASCLGPRRSTQRSMSGEIVNRSGHPVSDVTWDDAQKYVAWLNKVSGNGDRKPYRLPTEAEWEYAARANSPDPYSFTSANPSRDICLYANGADQSIGLLPHANQACSDGVGRDTAHVGRYKPNKFGLHDMHGNVWEWVADCWAPNYAAEPVDGSARAVTPCDRRVARGGSWRSGLSALRSATRNAFDHSHARATLGFRTARDID